MKKFITLAIIIAIIVGITWLYNNWSINRNDTSNYEAERTATTQESNETENNAQSEEDKQAEEAQKQADEQAQAQAQADQEQAQAESQQAPVEAEEIASFSTKIYTKESGRQNNLSITCSALNDTDVANGETFSFCNTVGRSSPSKGYKKADIFRDGEKIKGYGGGNCQVSTTLYNAVLAAPGLSVTERHEHSNKVPYIKEGKDAAVSYGTYDFKFVNNSGSAVRIKASNSSDAVSISLIKLI